MAFPLAPSAHASLDSKRLHGRVSRRGRSNARAETMKQRLALLFFVPVAAAILGGSAGCATTGGSDMLHDDPMTKQLQRQEEMSRISRQLGQL